MSIDYGERERQFLEALKTDTGRTLEEWMAAIAAQGLTQRNDIIDWLRRQNFMFSKASWLERIHNNGGRPIYAGGAGPRPQVRARNQASRLPRTPPSAPPDPPRVAPPSPPPVSVQPQTPPAVVVSLPQRAPTVAPAAAPPQAPAPSPVPTAVASVSPGQTESGALDALLARAKAFRPLAAYLIAEIRKVVPEVSVSAHDGFVGLRIRDRDFALIAISPKELRLGLALKTKPSEATLVPAKLPALQGAPSMSWMAVLNDARQITAPLLAAVGQAATEA